MRVLHRFAVALILALPAAPAAAEVTLERVRVLVAEMDPVQALNSEMDRILVRLANGSAAFDEQAIGQTDLASALARARAALVGAADGIAALEKRAGLLTFSSVGDPDIDATLNEVVTFVHDKPALLRRLMEALEAQVAAAEAGDLATVYRLSGQMAEIAMVQIDSESAMLKLQLAVIDRRHPQHGLSSAWLATNDGMRHANEIALLDENAVIDALQALPGRMRIAGSRMRLEIARSRAAVADMRNRSGGGWVGAVLNMRSGANREILARLLDEYEDALAVEDDIANLLDHGAVLFARLAEGDTSDEIMAGLVRFDETFQRLGLQRLAEGQDRLRVLQQLQAQ